MSALGDARRLAGRRMASASKVSVSTWARRSSTGINAEPGSARSAPPWVAESGNRNHGLYKPSDTKTTRSGTSTPAHPHVSPCFLTGFSVWTENPVKAGGPSSNSAVEAKSCEINELRLLQTTGDESAVLRRAQGVPGTTLGYDAPRIPILKGSQSQGQARSAPPLSSGVIRLQSKLALHAGDVFLIRGLRPGAQEHLGIVSGGVAESIGAIGRRPVDHLGDHGGRRDSS